MTPLELLDGLATHSVVVHAQEGKLKLSASHKPPKHLLEALKEHKAELLHYLAHVAPNGSAARVTSVRSAEPGKAGCVVWEYEPAKPEPLASLSVTTSERVPTHNTYDHSTGIPSSYV